MCVALITSCDLYDAAALKRPADAAASDGDGPAVGCTGEEGCVTMCPGACEEVSDACDLRTDPVDCGACGNTCELPNAAAVCVDGRCVVVECDPGYGNCDGDPSDGCETPLYSMQNCGQCGRTCTAQENATAECTAGACAIGRCDGGFGDCDRDPGNGCETPLDTLANCGGCGIPCNLQACAGGACSDVQCVTPMADCDGDGNVCEADVTRDVNHCGGCGRACAFQTLAPNGSLSCTGGRCEIECDVGFGDCDGAYESGCEAALASDAQHCGACGRDCSDAAPNTIGSTCVDGACVIAGCASGFEDCDGQPDNGCERNVRQDGLCPPDSNCRQEEFGTHTYFFCDNRHPFGPARERCQTRTGGDLVAVDNDTENDFIVSNLDENAWLGASDAAREGLWRWVRDGVPFWRGAADGEPLGGQYEKWNEGRPNDTNRTKNCAEMFRDGSWADLDCASPRAFVCEVTPDECPDDPAKLEPGQCGCGVADADADGIAECSQSAQE